MAEEYQAFREISRAFLKISHKHKGEIDKSGGQIFALQSAFRKCLGVKTFPKTHLCVQSELQLRSPRAFWHAIFSPKLYQSDAKTWSTTLWHANLLYQSGPQLIHFIAKCISKGILVKLLLLRVSFSEIGEASCNKS